MWWSTTPRTNPTMGCEKEDCPSLHSVSTFSSVDELDENDCDNWAYAKPRQRVKFSRDVQSSETLSRACYTVDEGRRVWYSKREYQIIRDKRKLEMDLIDEGYEFSFDDEEHCSDGLYTTQEDFWRKERHHSAQQAVFAEQDQQRIDCVSHPGLIRDAYQGQSERSKKFAQTRAARNEEEVRYLVHRRTSEICSPASEIASTFLDTPAEMAYLPTMLCRSSALNQCGFGEAFDEAAWLCY